MGLEAAIPAVASNPQFDPNPEKSGNSAPD
jgi:hypothetical protein